MLAWLSLLIAAPAWQARTDAELRADLRRACEESVADGKPVLIEFSAAWCGDCRWVQAAETSPEVVAEMAQWHRVVVDVGRFERHTELLKSWGGNAITWFVASRPKSCGVRVEDWPVTWSSAFEASQLGPTAKPSDLVKILSEARGRK